MAEFQREQHAAIIAEGVENLTRLPEHLRGGMKRYLDAGIQPGFFLTACIENNLVEAVTRVGDTEDLRQIATYLYTFAPAPAWGSKEKRLAWQERVKGLTDV